MATSPIPTLIDALFTQATAALPDRLVVDGFGATNDYNSNVLMVGVDDPDATSSARSVDTGQSPGPMATTRPRDEQGSITCAALSWTGSTDQKAARDAAFATLAAVENLLRADPTIGVTGYRRLVLSIGSLSLSQNQYAATENTAGGVDALLIFNVDYIARI
jgi:hypothetical protein